MVAVATKSDASAYFPAAGAAWQSVAPRDAGFDAGKLTEAIAFANAHECAPPNARATTLARPLTATGIDELVVVPLPN